MVHPKQVVCIFPDGQVWNSLSDGVIPDSSKSFTEVQKKVLTDIAFHTESNSDQHTETTSKTFDETSSDPTIGGIEQELWTELEHLETYENQMEVLCQNPDLDPEPELIQIASKNFKPQEDPITDPIISPTTIVKELQKIGLWYNKEYKLLICIQCKMGLTPKGVYNHLTSKEMEVWRKTLIGKYEKVSIAVDHSLKKGNKSLKPQFETGKDELITKKFIGSEEELWTLPQDKWTEELSQRTFDQIEGLMVYDGLFACNLCSMAVRTMTSYYHHMGEYHKGADPHRPPYLCQAHNLFASTSYFVQINGTKQVLANDKLLMLPDFGQIHHTDKDLAAALSKTGIAKRLEHWRNTRLYSRLSCLKTSQKKQYESLQKAVHNIWHSNTEVTNKMSPLMRKLVTNPPSLFPTLKFLRREFTLIEPSTVNHYASSQIKFIGSLILDLQQEHRFYTLSDKQTKLLQSLCSALELSQAIEDYVKDLLFELYFPEDLVLDFEAGDFQFAILSFVALQCWNKDDGYVKLANLPILLATIQYFIRLLACGHMDKAGPVEFEKFCNSYLNDMKITPYGGIRTWIVWISKCVRSQAKSPTDHSSPIIWSQGHVLKVKNHEISIIKFKMYVASQLAALEKYMEEEVLLRLITLDEAKASCKKILNEGDQSICVFSVTPLWDSSVTEYFISALLKKFDFSFVENRLSYNKKSLQNWLQSVRFAWHAWYCLFHVTQGLPTFGTQELEFKAMTTESGTRHLFYNGKTLYFFSKFRKYGKSYPSYHFLPGQVAALLSILLVFVRPLEVMIAKNDEISNYQNFIFVTEGKPWTVPNLAHILQHWFLNGLSVDVQIRDYRYIAINILYQHILPEIQDTQVIEALKRASDENSGHSSAVAAINYARGDGTHIQRDLRKCQEIARLWHHWLNLEPDW
ncbi:hypothetical protein BDN72DRAFT_905741 [Pluteus cervinus]|uniref:Uncharacterized protein n=1 Tax=Pluteus cervinus TaxID=181527 RepID=A0ACD3A171_9AGAR|nr:hypothetical protein BDN72DRAFT_905741 [Pluteus cervinus]